MALVIGNSNYVHLQPLKNPGNDAREMANTLTELNFDVYQYHDLSQQGVKEAVRKFTFQSEDADVVWIYYAGHGFQEDGLNFLAPIDANIYLEGDSITRNHEY